MDTIELVKHHITAVAKASMHKDPFPYIYMSPFFPPDLYQRLLDGLPPTDWYRPLGGRDVRLDGTSTRDFFDVLDDKGPHAERGAHGIRWVWDSIAEALTHPSFYQTLLFKFAEPLSKRFRMHPDNVLRIPVVRQDFRLFRDTIDYRLPPHTDANSKAITLQAYLPADAKWENLGTSLYEREYRAGSRHDTCYREVVRLPFKPNSAYAFPILTADMPNPSWHGREPLTQPGVQRDTMIYNLYYR